MNLMSPLKSSVTGKIWFRYGFENLLLWLFLYLVVSPFFETAPFARALINIVFGIVLLSAVAAMSRTSKILTPAIVLLALTLTLYCLDFLDVVSFSLQATLATRILYLGLLIFSFTRLIMTSRKIDLNLICAALCLYLIVGLTWGSIYHLLDLLIPSSFSGHLLSTAASHIERAHYFNYFSFITMTTLGYGDITPQTRAAASLCQAEAILGQFFTVVLIARLVGIQVAQEFSPEKEEPVKNELSDKEI